jgi:hypothetical protein
MISQRLNFVVGFCFWYLLNNYLIAQQSSSEIFEKANK